MKKVLALLSVIIMIIGIIYLNTYRTIRTFDMDGYLFTSDNITSNLVNGAYATKDDVDYAKVKYDDALYQGRGKYFIGGTHKTKVNMDYPLVSSDSETLLLLMDNANLLDKKFKKTSTYKNSFITGNKLYNETSYEEVGDNTYLFLELNNGIEVNLSPITIIRNSKEYTIPINSFISFLDSSIRYYYMKNDKYIYKEINGIDIDTEVIIDGKNYTYSLLLEKLGLSNKTDDEVIEEETIVEEVVEEETKKEEVATEVKETEKKYVKPKVSFMNESSKVYSVAGLLNITDPTSQIVKYPTFEFWSGKTLVLRKSFSNSGAIEVKGLLPNTDYDVVGYFHYKNEDKKEVKAEFTHFKISTKDISGLEKLKIDVQSLKPTNNNVELKGIKLNNDSNDEVLKGIKKIIVHIGNNQFQLSNNIINKLLKFQSQDFSSSKSLHSNTLYEVTFEAIDIAGNSLEIESEKYEFKTTKQEPKVKISVKNKDISKASIKVEIDNPDDVSINNLYYVLFNTNDENIRQEKITDLDVDLENLDANEAYRIEVYGNYDLEDGNGIQKDILLSSGKFATEPLSTLGYVKVEFSNVSSTKDSISFSLSLSQETNNKLKELLTHMNLVLKSADDNSVVDEIKLEGEDFQRLASGETLDLNIDNLLQNKKYYFDITSYASFGSKIHEIKTLSNKDSFHTMKDEARILVVNKFINENMIDFDVSVEDIDHAIESKRVLMEVRNTNGSLIYYKELGINEDYFHVTLEKLDKNQYYEFKYYVEEYNVGYDNSTFQNNVTLYEESIYTEEGLFGNVRIESLLKQITSKNIFDISNNSRWKTGGNRDVSRRKSDKANNIISLGAKNGYRTYSYYLPEYKGKQVTVSFDIKYADKNESPVYICNTGSNNCASYSVPNISGSEWTHFSKTMTINTSSPYVSFTIREVDGNNNITTKKLKNVQIEEGNKETSYVKYKEKDKYLGTFVSNLTDRNHEISKDDFYYYLRFYEDDELVDTTRFDFNDGYAVYDAIHEHEITPNKNYKVALSVKKKITSTSESEEEEDGYRFYDLGILEFTSDDEIRTIRTYNELINVHTSGTYLVAEDIDYTDKTGNIGITFNGTIDFQGHKIIKDTSYVKTNGDYANAANYIFYNIGRNGTVKNLDIHYYFDDVARSELNGIAYYNYGLIENVMVTLEQGNNKPNTIISLIARQNYGSIKNFVIHTKDKLSLEQSGGLVAYTNYGTIMNGYLYGENIDASFPNSSLSSKYVGGVARRCETNAYIANVYSLVGIDLYEDAKSSQYQYEVGNIVGASDRAILRNIYTYSTNKNRNLSADINAYSGTFNISNMYYANTDDYSGTYSNKISPNAFRNDSFQNIINADDNFDIENFVKYGYYPHLKWPAVMPNQEYIPLPNEDEGKIDYLTIENKEEKDDGTVTATLVFQNIGYDTITGFKFSNDLNCRIISQENADGKSKVKVEFSSPSSYISKYSLTTITYRNSAGIGDTINYGNKERIVEVDMYKNIYNMDDFKAINNNTSQNFKLQTDLDFNNISFYINNFTGKLDGNNFVISNIRETDRNFINTLNGGTIKNLHINNYTKNGNSGYGGFIGTVKGSANIDNVHLNNVSVTDSNTYVGGFIGITQGALISNSSITNVHVYETNPENMLFSGRYGGFIGQNENTVIQNCYVQGLKMEITSALSTYGIGGIVGRHYTGYIQDSYAVGEIHTNQQEVGGIVGYNNAYIERVISNVDIYTQQDSLGGIVGYSTNANIASTLSLGVVYTSKDAINLNRTVGNRTVSEGNYAWSEQLLNGIKSTSVSGDILLTTEELKEAITYESFIGGEFDLSNLENSKGHNLIPKLKYLSSNKLLPYQKDNEYYYDNSLKIESIDVNKSVSDAIVQILINNPNNYQVTDIVIPGLKVISVNRNVTQNGITQYEVNVKPEKYYDSYLIESIKYLDGEEEKSMPTSTKIDLIFYKDIGTFEDWQKISTTEYENYRLVNDIDFAGKTNVKTRVLINRLEGTDGGHTIKNIEINASSGHVGIIDTLASNINDVSFENIKINSTSSTAYTGIIRFLNGTMSNVHFKDIEISSKGNYVGSIGYNQAPDIRNVTLENMNISGASYLGSLAGYSRYFDISYVTGNHLTVTGTADYIGGIMGAHDNASYPTMFNFTVDDVTTTGRDYVGGIFGRGAAEYSIASNVHVSGRHYIGGLAGHQYFTYITHGYIKDSDITGSGADIGGAYGYSYDEKYLYGDNLTVTATRTNNTNNVGGLVGRGSYTRYYCGIKNSTITNAGNYTGGIVGKLENAGLQTSYVYNTTVRGYQYVGGLAGWHSSTSSAVYYNISNATVQATDDYAGGIMGYLNNLNTTDATNRIYIYRNIVAGSAIESNGMHAASIAPISQKEPFDSHFYDNYISADVNTNGGNISQFFIGNDNENADYTSYLRAIRVYEGSKYNGENIRDFNFSDNITTIEYSRLRNQNTFKELLPDANSTQKFIFTKVEDGYYPYLNFEWNGSGLQYYPLPTSATSFKMARPKNSSLVFPDVSVYVSDVDKINVEFSKLLEGATFVINNQEYELNQLTYTFYYDFNNDFEIELNSGTSSKIIKISAEDLRSISSVDKDNYYFLNGEKIASNEDIKIEGMSINKKDNNPHFQLLANSSNTLKGVNIYQNKILLNNQNIYNIETKEIVENAFDNLTPASLTDLYHFTYENNEIKTYYNYSTINGEIIDKQLFVKNGTIEVVDSTLNNIKDNTLVDYYNGNNYLVYLGEDAKLHSLKDNITLPDRFVNQNIKSIKTDIYNDSNIIMVLYKNGDYVVFNYRNGEVLSKVNSKKNDIISYYSSYMKNNNLKNKNNKEYQSSLQLKKKLETKGTDLVLEEQTDSNQDVYHSYIDVYNPVTNKYEIYQIAAKYQDKKTVSLNKDLKESSKTNEIYNNKVLYEYYIGDRIKKRTLIVGVVGIMVTILFGIITSTILLNRNLKKD